MDLALELISKERGLVIYHREDGRNIGLVNKVNAYNPKKISFFDKREIVIVERISAITKQISLIKPI